MVLSGVGSKYQIIWSIYLGLLFCRNADSSVIVHGGAKTRHWPTLAGEMPDISKVV